MVVGQVVTILFVFEALASFTPCTSAKTRARGASDKARASQPIMPGRHSPSCGEPRLFFSLLPSNHWRLENTYCTWRQLL
mmetsp:Transcript_4431/g.13424  ORF Transcript_4431/g.13424 Transcript_4431/m.13424 type:complete len:80 (+) Transcript_4431:1377-1616(+)